MSQLDWDREYRDGKWGALRDVTEHVRYAILAGCILGYGREAPKRVLDLGCGQGVLREHLRTESLDRYTGIDLSIEAVEQARLADHPRSVFLAAAIEAWEPDSKYDAIVFNEVLYYLPQPVAAVEKYAGSLAMGGSILVSMWYPAISLRHPTRGTNIRFRVDHARTWRALSRRLEVVNDIVVMRHGRRVWRIQQLQPDWA